MGPDLYVTDQESEVQENLLGGTNPFTSRFLHPSLVQSSRSIQPMKTVQVPKQALSFHLFLSLPHRSKNSGREVAGWNHPFTGQFLQPSLVQSSRSIQHMQTVQAPK